MQGCRIRLQRKYGIGLVDQKGPEQWAVVQLLPGDDLVCAQASSLQQGCEFGIADAAARERGRCKGQLAACAWA